MPDYIPFTPPARPRGAPGSDRALAQATNPFDRSLVGTTNLYQPGAPMFRNPPRTTFRQPTSGAQGLRPPPASPGGWTGKSYAKGGGQPQRNTFNMNKSAAQQASTPAPKTLQFPHIAVPKNPIKIEFTQPMKNPKYGFASTVKVTVSGERPTDMKLRVMSVDAVARMPKSIEYPLIRSNVQEVDGKNKSVVKSYYYALIPYTCDQHIYVVNKQRQVSSPYPMSVPTDRFGLDYGDKLALHLASRRAVLKAEKAAEIKQKLAKLKEKTDKTRLRAKALLHLKQLVEAMLPPDVIAQGTFVEPRKLRRTEDVVNQAVAEMDLSEEILKQIPTMVPGLSVAIAAGTGVAKLGMASFLSWRVYKIKSTIEMIEKYPVYEYKSREGPALFERMQTHLSDQAVHQIKGAVKKLIEAAVRATTPGANGFVSTGVLAERVFSTVLARSWEIYEIDLTNNMLDLADAAETSEGYYDTIQNGHIVVAAHVINEYGAKDLSGARREFSGRAAEINKIMKGTEHLKKEAKKVTEKSNYRMVTQRGRSPSG